MLRTQANRLAVLIPAYRPSGSLLELVRALVEKSFPHIVVVDDGSGAEFCDLFDRVAELSGVELLRHATNLGKGAALKTGLNYVLCRYPGLAGVVTADADGQHHPDDIERVGETLLANPGSLVLGCRAFRREAPLRSLIGNVVTRAIVHALLDRGVSDTQTGLRGIPSSLAPRILKVEANGYEFELEMLIAAHRWGVPLVEESIRAIYEPGNPSSHFNPVVDSMKIYFIILRFGSVSLFTALLDNLIFILARHYGASVLLSQILGRAVALAFNYTMVRRSVFHSRQRHSLVLPKYLELTVVSGLASYGGIRLLTMKTGMDAVPAKLMVESLLFLLNFAVQRLFIFKKGANGAQPPAGTADAWPASRVRAGVALVFVGALASEAHGFFTGKLFSQNVWDPVGVERFLTYTGVFLGVALPILTIAPWSFAALIAGSAAVGTAIAIGPVALLAVSYYLVSSCALGSRMLGRGQDDAPVSQLLATLLGAAAWIFAMTLVARMPVNYPVVWAGLLAVPVLLDWRGAWRRLERLWRLLCAAELRGYAERAAFALTVFVLLAHWLVALLPETSADGLAMHLAVPANIAANHAMTFDPSRFVWAVMPMGADFSYAIVYLLGGEYAAHLLDYALLLIFLALLYFALRRWAPRAPALLLLALFASAPMVQLVTASLFVENMLAGMVVGMMAALWRFGETGERRFFYVAAALGGTAMSIKLGALPFVALAAPFLAFEAARHWKSLGPRPAAVCGLAAAMLLGTAAPPYAIAYVKTGNPVFPFFSDKIRSPLIPPDAGLVDDRFNRPLAWNTPYDLTFRSSLAYEGQNGSFGFQYLLLAPLGIVAILLAPRRGGAASAAVVALGAAAIIMRTQPNARYLYAALPLLSVPCAALLGRVAGARWLYRGLLAFVVASVAMNMRFMPSASYYHRDFCLRNPFSMAERDQYRAAAAPIREVIAYFNREHANSGVLLTASASIAGLNGDIYENNWHQVNNLRQIRRVQSVGEMAQLMRSWKVGYFISPKASAGDEVQPPLFREMVERCTDEEFEQSYVYLAQLRPECRPSRAELDLVGLHDDHDPALLYRGDWTKARAADDPDRHTITYTNAPGSEVEIAFEGTALTYIYTKAENRGTAAVTVDGVHQGTLDLYSATLQWRSRTRFCCFAPGRHVAVIRWTGLANPLANGTYIDLDSFRVE